MSHRTLSGQSPHTRGKAVDDFVEKLLNLHPRQTLQLEVEGNCVPDFHTDENIYEVRKTKVSTTKNGEESFFHAFLGSADVHSTEDPVFKLTVSRSVPEKMGYTQPDTQWKSHWLNARTGRNRYGNIRWTQIHDAPSNLTIIEDINRCSECDRPL